MRRTSNTLHIPMTRLGPASFPETNPEVWVQLGEEPCNTNVTIMETV